MAGDLIFVGDVHLGRRPAGLDGALLELGLGPRRLSPAAAWKSTVEEAIERGARALVLAGDVVEGENDRFEAYGHLERGVHRLHEAGVAVLGVAGNHDGLVLPRLADRLEHFQLLGRGGVWACVPLPGEGPAIDLLGWSFPGRHVREDPLSHPSFPRALEARRAGATCIGVLHGDLDQAGSPYAPIDRASLRETPVHAWFLGHVHKPGDLGGDRPIGYLGSLVGLDVGETGPRGPWAVTVRPGAVQARQIPLVPVRWESVDLTLDDGAGPLDEDTLHARIEEGVQEYLGGTKDLGDRRLRVVICRVHLRGRLRDRRAVRRLVEPADRLDLTFSAGGVHCVVEKVLDHTLPAVDLDRLAAEPSLVGHLARRIREISSGGAGEQVEDLVEQATGRLQPFETRRWTPDPEHHPLPNPREALLEGAWRALERLLDSRRDPEAI